MTNSLGNVTSGQGLLGVKVTLMSLSGVSVMVGRFLVRVSVSPRVVIEPKVN